MLIFAFLLLFIKFVLLINIVMIKLYESGPNDSGYDNEQSIFFTRALRDIEFYIDQDFRIHDAIFTFLPNANIILLSIVMLRMKSYQSIISIEEYSSEIKAIGGLYKYIIRVLAILIPMMKPNLLGYMMILVIFYDHLS